MSNDKERGKNRGRGPQATADMKARLAAGATVDQLWERMKRAESGGGYSYDLAAKAKGKAKA